RFNLVMVGPAVNRLEVNIGAGAAGKAFKEIIDQLRLQIAHQSHLDLRVNDGSCAPAEVHRGQAQSFVHGHQEIARAHDAALVAQCAVERLAQGKADVLYRVVLVHVKIAGGFELQVERAVPRKKLQHVVEEADPGRHVIASAPLDGESHLDVC